jgi:hypothetical protein
MAPHARAMIAAAAFAFITGKKVAGMHDHSSGKDLRIAAECRGDQLQGYDGDRSCGFGGALPELYDAGARSFVALEIDGANAQGFDRASASAFSAHIADQRVQLYDHVKSAWFTFDIEVVEPTAS